MVKRLANIDVVSRYAGGLPDLVVQIAFGVLCSLGAICVRFLIDLWYPGTGPFALLYPSVLIATLFGRWRAGFVTYVITFLWLWYGVFSPFMSFAVDRPELPRVVITAISAGVTLVLAEAFRSAARTAMDRRDEALEHSEMLRQELDHRTRNNFQLMNSLIQLQHRQEKDPTAKRALRLAAGRIESFTSAYARLPVAPSAGDTIPMKPYLTSIVDSARSALFSDKVSISAQVDDISLPRDKAAAIGLYTNEALTNCAKYAFDPDATGSVSISFAEEADGWILSIVDDGKGKDAKAGTTGGLGSALMDAFAKQADATHATHYPGNGCTVTLRGK